MANRRIVSKSFLSGFIRALDIGGSLKRYPDFSEAQRYDYEALRSDWEHVGEYITEATSHYAKTATA